MIDLERLMKICPELVISVEEYSELWNPNEGRAKKRINVIAHRFLRMAERQTELQRRIDYTKDYQRGYDDAMSEIADEITMRELEAIKYKDALESCLDKLVCHPDFKANIIKILAGK